MDILIRILSFVNILANSFEVDGRTLGRNAIGGSVAIIEQLRRSCQILLGIWSPFSWLLSAAAVPVYFSKRCMKFTSRGFSEGMPPSLLTSSEL